MLLFTRREKKIFQRKVINCGIYFLNYNVFYAQLQILITRDNLNLFL